MVFNFSQASDVYRPGLLDWVTTTSEVWRIVVKKHRLLLYQRLSGRVREVLLLIVLSLAGLVAYDLLVAPVLGSLWYAAPVALAAAFALWYYYAILMRRAALQVRPDMLRLQGPLVGMNISYGRIHSVTPTAMSQQYPREQLSGHEQGLLSGFTGHTCVLVELRSLPKGYGHRRLWFHRLLFGETRPGLLLLVEDWMALSQDIDGAHTAWQERRKQHGRADNRSPAARVLDM